MLLDVVFPRLLFPHPGCEAAASSRPRPSTPQLGCIRSAWREGCRGGSVCREEGCGRDVRCVGSWGRIVWIGIGGVLRGDGTYVAGSLGIEVVAIDVSVVHGLPHLPVKDVEDALAREVATLRIPSGEIAALRQQVTDSLEHQQAVEQETRRRLKKELSRLDVKEERLLDLASDGGLVGKKLRKRLRDLQTRRAMLQQQLAHTDEQLRRQANTVLAYLDLLADPARFYELASPVVKRKLLTAFYAQIWLDDDGSSLQPATEPREIVTRLQRAGQQAVRHANHAEGGSLRSRSDAETPEVAETAANKAANRVDGDAPGETDSDSSAESLTPVASAKRPRSETPRACVRTR